MNQRDQLLHKLGGYYLIPHELLHVLAYRLIGKPCHYQWGDWRVTSLAQKSRREGLFVTLMPFVVPWSMGLVCYVIFFILSIATRLPPERYIYEAPWWHFIFPVISFIVITYTHTCWKDLLKAYWWLFTYKADQDSPQPQHPANEQPIRRDKP
jgi:hypothetical protein